MSDSRIQRLSQLFESKNRILRQEAAQQLAQFPLSNDSLRQTLRKQFCSSLWEARASSAHAFGLLLERLSKELDRKCADFKDYEPEKLRDLDLDNVLTHFKVLLSCEEEKIESKKMVSKKLSSKEQRRLVDQHLDLNAQTGVSSRLFIGDDDFDEDTNIDSTNEQSTSSMGSDIKEELSQSVKSESQEHDENVTEAEQSIRVLSDFLVQILCDLASANWMQRHGASLALCQVVTHALPMLSQQNIELIAIRIIQVLALDRFNDFVTGANAVAPVRETTAQALSMLMLKIGTETPLVRSVIGQLEVLMLMDEEKNWPCRQTALIVLKYFFSMCSSGAEFASLFESAVSAMKDEVDEVVSTSVHAVSSLFANDRIQLEDKNRLVGEVMEIVWIMLMEGDAENLMDGVSSLLNDLLGIIQTWLCVEQNALLNTGQFRHIVNLFDPSQITTTVRAMECIYLSLSKGSQLGDEELFLFIKMLYRCLLFVQLTDSQRLLDLAFSALIKLISVYDESRLAALDKLQATIGLWIGCLSYDYKNAEIDVFTHNVDGPSSTPPQPMEILCGDEARFLDGPTKLTTFMDRKCLAARFLSPLIDILYRSGIKIQDQPLNLSLQLHFIPYLRTNSLHQRLGIALILNCWARMFRRAFNAQKQQEYPTLLVQVLDSILNEANTQRALYDEVAGVVSVLTNECNEFRRHCLQKGVSPDECPAIENTPNMEEIVGALYDQCKKRLKKPADLEALDGRKNYLIQLINATKREIRTNTNRLNCLCASTLFYLGHLPQTLTPMIRPLIDATDTEDNERLAEECFFDSFPILFAVTIRRQPCPHAKILKQLAVGLLQDDKYSPKLTNSEVSTSQESVQILSAGQSPPPQQPVLTKTRNCQVIIRQLGQQFGVSLLQICPEIASYLRLDTLDLDTETGIESLLCNLEFLRLLATPTGHRPSLQELRLLIQQFSSPNPAIRFRLARFVTELATFDLCFALNTFFDPVINQGSLKIDDHSARAGAVELIVMLSQRLQAPQLIAVASLLAPKALALISDSVECIRELAAQAFGRLVSLLHLQSPEKLPSLSDELQQQLDESRDFVNVLSAPSRLQSVKQTDIAGLRADITLRPYQLEGITWLTFLSRFSLNGILGDDMGLGKTVQTLSLLAMERRKGSTAPTLIVCPRTLATHWCKEWQNYFPNEATMLKFGEAGTAQPAKLANTDQIIVVSYEELRSNVKKFNCISWKYIVLDEGHCIRNPSTQMFEAIMSLRARHKLLLSGTPVQNSPADLWALFRFLMPGYLFTQKVFHSKFLRPILACRNTKASDQQTKEGEEVIAQLHRLILPFVLRRLKTDVLKELPDKVVQECTCQLTDVQAALYTAIVEKCTLIKKEENGDEKETRLSPLHTLIALRQLVDHPIMIRDFLLKIGWTNYSLFDPNSPNALSIELSGKLMALRELLQECQIGEQLDKSNDAGDVALSDLPNLSQHRALVFCQWRASVELIAQHLENQSLGIGIRYLRLDGTIPPDQRQEVVDRFNNDPSIDLLLVTTHIGGVGLTLTGADVVIFLDHDFNPVKDLQAVDRAHRLGQTRTVNVYRLITQGSIEEKIMRFQKFKLDTANALIGADNRSISSMATDELLELFNLDNAQSVSTSAQQSAGPSKKRRRRVPEASAADQPEQFSMEELWDSSQYDDQHSIQLFIEKIGK